MSPTIRYKYKYFHSTVQGAEDTAKVSFLPFDVRPRNVKLNPSIKEIFAPIGQLPP